VDQSIALVFAHPDDESFGCAGTVAKYSRLGVCVDIICATRGEQGMRLDVPSSVSTAAARETELRNAASIMGVRAVHFLGYMDAELDKISPDEIAGRIRDILSKIRPDVMITFGPDGITGHADHVAVSKAATAAYRQLAPGGWPKRLYYVTLPASMGAPMEDWGLATRPDEDITTTIDISGYFDVKLKAVAAHRSQQDSRDFLEAMQQRDKAGPLSSSQMFATKEFFYLAGPEQSGQIKETSLFQ